MKSMSCIRVQMSNIIVVLLSDIKAKTLAICPQGNNKDELL